MRTLSILLPLALLLPGCVVLEIKAGNGVPATDTRPLETFDAVANETGVDVRVAIGEEPTAVVSCDENLVPSIRTDVEEGVLHVRVDDRDGHPVSLMPETDCSVDVIAVDLRALTATDSGDLEVSADDALALDALTATGSGDLLVHAVVDVAESTVATTGSGSIELDGLTADDATLSSSGSGDIRAARGSAGTLRLSSSGSGDVLVRGLNSAQARVTLTGSGDAEVTVTQDLTASLSGSGDLTVWGDPPARDIDTTGSGAVLLGE